MVLRCLGFITEGVFQKNSFSMEDKERSSRLDANIVSKSDLIDNACLESYKSSYTTSGVGIRVGVHIYIEAFQELTIS